MDDRRAFHQRYHRIEKPPHVPDWKLVEIVVDGKVMRGHFEPAIPAFNRFNRSRNAG